MGRDANRRFYPDAALWGVVFSFGSRGSISDFQEKVALVAKQILKLTLISSLLAFLLALVIVPQTSMSDEKNTDVLLRVLGGTADLASDKAFKQADVYYHAGMMDKCPDESHHHEEHGSHRHEEDSEPVNLPLANFIRNIYAQTQPGEHMHIHGESEKELIPWFIVSTRLNPRNIEAWRVGTYWFFRTGDLKRAEDFISKGISANPSDYRLHMDQGIMYHRLREWELSIKSLETARLLWKNNSDDAPFDLKAIKTYFSDSKKHLLQ